MSKFQPGDKVIFLKLRHKNDGRINRLNKILTLVKIDEQSPPDTHWIFEENGGYIIRDSEIEHANIYFSPLYKELT